jgi:hypothetical protein
VALRAIFFIGPGHGALGQKQTSAHLRVMSALPPEADIAESDWHVRFVPIADSCCAAISLMRAHGLRTRTRLVLSRDQDLKRARND